MFLHIAWRNAADGWKMNSGALNEDCKCINVMCFEFELDSYFVMHAL